MAIDIIQYSYVDSTVGGVAEKVLHSKRGTMCYSAPFAVVTTSVVLAQTKSP